MMIMRASIRWIQSAVVFVCLALALSAGAAEVPEIIHYEGYLTNTQGIALSDGDYTVTFRIYDTATGGSPLWTENWDNLPLTRGRFRVFLGSNVPLTAAFFQQYPSTYLGITVGTDNEMLPRQRIASVPYALSTAGSAIPTKGIIMWSGAINAIPDGWALCDGTNGTPDLRNRFIVGVGSNYQAGATGGLDAVTLSISQMPTHAHGGTTGNDSPDHTHYDSGHAHAINESNNDGGDASYQARTGTGSIDLWLNTTISKANLGGASVRHKHSVAAEGGGGPLENRPPYYALAFIMKL